ncbi:sensor histidine kinase [Sphingobacterium sp. JUb56]|uniref:sensor histidine kinase n=1 Tax=Sphingobacterium sp. JUb56 TaxID=2587145 RepID=UPI001607A3ED|nr:histidine kinase [Sphingobacterium sp. JUb56]MBB2950823.1 sensor histidine kinase YesM [Sphingobacterium sp. JUb56]
MKNLLNTNSLTRLLIEPEYSLLRTLLLQSAILAISIGIFFDAPDKLNLSTDRILGWFSYHLFLNCLVYVNKNLLFPRFLAKNKMADYLISVVIFTVFALCIMVILQELFYDIAVTRQQPSPIAIFFSITSSLFAIVLFLTGISALQLFKQWLINNHRIHELQLATSRIQQHFLKSQINPHFLFNMINNANILVDDDPITASMILKKFEDILQYQFSETKNALVPLLNDIKFLEDYLELEKLRRDQCDFSLKREGNFDSITVPPLLFVHFVENAVKHSSDRKGSYVNMEFKVVNRKLYFFCENSKPTTPSKRVIGGLGLENIKRRLALLYHKKHQLHIADTDQRYTVTLYLDLQ